MRFGTSDFGLYFHVVGETPFGTTLASTGQTSPDRRDVVWQTSDAAEGLTCDHVARANQARRLQQTRAFPSDADFESMVRGHMLQDCNISTRDITRYCLFGVN